MKFDPKSLVNRRLTFIYHELKMKARVVAAGYHTPVIVYRSNRDPLPFITVAPDGTTSSMSTDPESVRIFVGSEMYKSVRFEPLSE